MSFRLHRKSAGSAQLKTAVVTVSSTRTPESDESGKWIRKFNKKEGHDLVDYRLVKDCRDSISGAVLEIIENSAPDAIIVSGGTGLTMSDVTIEAIRPLFRKELTSFGPIFGLLSFEEIESAAVLSRATAGIIEKTAVFCIPGSLNACKLACMELIYPELGHIVKHVRAE